MKRVLLAAVAILVLAVAATFLSRRQESTAPPPPTARADGAEIGRGEYLALVGDCLACHTVRGGKPYAGGLELPTPFGKRTSTFGRPPAPCRAPADTAV